MDALTELNFDWSQPCGEFPKDSMGRAGHAQNMTQFLIKKGQETSYVLNLNAKWGTGKTYFLRRWVAEIEDLYPTVYIDAWSSDHSDDPLLSVVSEVKKTLRGLRNMTELEAELFKGVAKTVKAAAPAVVKAVLKGQLKKWGGVNADDFIGLMSADDIADTGAKLVEEAINAHNESTQGVIKIKESIQSWLSGVVQDNIRQYPLFIFIDELDRCRPTYAIEMLETIKHIFDLKNVVFVVATDKEQLQHSIRAIYGAEFDSRLYLDRFFTRTVTLSNPSRADFILRKIKESDTFSNFAEDDENFVYMDSDEGYKSDMIELLSGIADGFNWPLRTVNLWLDRLEAALIISPRKMDIIILSFMMALETDDSDWLKKYKDGISIFKEERNDDTGKVNFKSFLITTRWSFGQYKKDLLDNGFDDMTNIMHSERHPQIDLLAFVKNRLSSLDYIGNNSLINLGDEYKKATTGQLLDMMRIGYDSNSPVYEPAALYLHGYFHEKNGTNLEHYFDICRYSSLMS